MAGAELLTLVGDVRHLAFDRSLPPSEALGRIRDQFRSYDHQGQLVSHDELERGRLDFSIMKRMTLDW